MSRDIFLGDEQATLELGKQLANICPKTRFTIFLEGDLGTGKTTFSRGLLQGLGYHGKVKSPTYTLVEYYNLISRPVFHFDLYRVNIPEELYYLGLDDYCISNSLWLVEWATKGGEQLPNPDLIIVMLYYNNARIANVHVHSTLGNEVYKQLNR